jgi:uncharacterized membrane protein
MDRRSARAESDPAALTIAKMANPRFELSRLARSACVLGAGIGGLFDGIVFHQILQWHHLISGPRPPQTLRDLELNTMFDGLFHAAAWVITLAGIWLVHRALRGDSAHVTGRVLSGGLVAGWGAFNVVEGVVDHYVLGIHHVRPGPDEALYDLAFQVWGAIFVAFGWLVIRRAIRAANAPAGRASAATAARIRKRPGQRP